MHTRLYKDLNGRDNFEDAMIKIKWIREEDVSLWVGLIRLRTGSSVTILNLGSVKVGEFNQLSDYQILNKSSAP